MRYLILMLVGMLSFPSFATTSVNVYKTEIAVPSNSPEIEQEARINGLEKVLIRTTGDLQVADNPSVKNALSHSDRYISQFGYIETGDKLVLRMEFNAKLIRELLTEAHLPIWPKERPNILIWLIDDQDYQRTIAWENIDSPEVLKMKSAAEHRGLPVIVPVGDFEDITKVQASDLWAGFVEPISIASRRYSPDAILIIRNEPSKASWSLYDQSAQAMLDVQISPQTGTTTGDTRLQRIIDNVTQYYVAKNSLVVEGESSKSLVVQVDNLVNPMAFFSVERALKSMNSVSSVDVVKLGDLYAVYRIHLLSQQDDFENEAMSISQLVFDQKNEPLESNGSTNALVDTPDTTEVVSDESGDNSTNDIVIRKPIPVNPDLIYHWQ